jgi:hypothetical protein
MLLLDVLTEATRRFSAFYLRQAGYVLYAASDLIAPLHWPSVKKYHVVSSLDFQFAQSPHH